MRGEFIRGDGLVIPNNITIRGSTAMLLAFARHEALAFQVALANCTPDSYLNVADMGEPTIGVGGYQRIAVPQDETGWPGRNVLNGESYIETDFLIFPAGAYEGLFNRMALLAHLSDSPTEDVEVLCLSSALQAPLQMTAMTDESLRKFKYRIYWR